MDYDQFDAEYGQVLVGAGSLDAATLQREVDRLRALADSLDTSADQRAARLAVAALEDAHGRTQPDRSDAMAAAVQVQDDARSGEGTPAEHVDRLRAGIDQIETIADAADPLERDPILAVADPLRHLVDSLTRPDLEPTAEANFADPGNEPSLHQGAEQL